MHNGRLIGAATLAALALSGCASIAQFAVVNAGLPILPDAPAPPLFAPRVVVPADGRLMIHINGRTFAAQAGPGLSSRAALSQDDAAMLFGPAALAFDRRGEWPGAFRSATRIGPIVVQSHRALASIGLSNMGGADSTGATVYPANVEWSAREVAGAAPRLGPYAIPATIVHFALRPAQAGEISFTLPLDAEDNRWGIASTSIVAGPQSVRFAFAPHFPRSVASAAAGGALARAQGGRFMGVPEPVDIAHGVARPARPVQLDRVLAIGPVRLRDVLVRTLDYGTAAGIADQVETADNPADILVTGRTDRQRPSYIVYLGADVLGGCSSILFDKAAMTITLSCVAAE